MLIIKHIVVSKYAQTKQSFNLLELMQMIQRKLVWFSALLLLGLTLKMIQELVYSDALKIVLDKILPDNVSQTVHNGEHLLIIQRLFV